MLQAGLYTSVTSKHPSALALVYSGKAGSYKRL